MSEENEVVAPVEEVPSEEVVSTEAPVEEATAEEVAPEASSEPTADSAE